MHNKAFPWGKVAERKRGRMRVNMMTNDDILRRSQTLRKEMTREERHLWYDFLKTYPVQFKRQYPIGPYFADFYCYRAKLIVELDGSQHCEADEIAYDNRRTEYIEQQGFAVFRVSNRDVTTQFRSVCEAIDHAVQNRVKG